MYAGKCFLLPIQKKKDQGTRKLPARGRKVAASHPQHHCVRKHHKSDLQNHALKIKDQKKKAGARK